MIKLLFNTLSILKKKQGKVLEMIKAAINHVLDDVCTQTGCIRRANVCTKKCTLFETFSCFVSLLSRLEIIGPEKARI